MKSLYLHLTAFYNFLLIPTDCKLPIFMLLTFGNFVYSSTNLIARYCPFEYLLVIQFKNIKIIEEYFSHFCTITYCVSLQCSLKRSTKYMWIKYNCFVSVTWLWANVLHLSEKCKKSDYSSICYLPFHSQDTSNFNGV